MTLEAKTVIARRQKPMKQSTLLWIATPPTVARNDGIMLGMVSYKTKLKDT
ncbi:MAG: hypothetical protein QMO91_08665 [Candidatus Tisiphia sp.]|jgi:hypothetical protein|nr:hypothetical protein [Candidatus Tisiphia sp.]